MEQVLFVTSATIFISWLFKITGHMLGNSMDLPFPFLHKFGIGFTNTYISTPAICYQVYFWANYFGIFIK